MTITGHIARIKDPVWRVPLWSLWFIVPFAHAIWQTARRGHFHRFAQSSYWKFHAAAYLVGLEGWLA